MRLARKINNQERKRLFFYLGVFLIFFLVSYKFASATHKLGNLCVKTFPWDDRPSTDPAMIFQIPCELSDFFTLDKLHEATGNKTVNSGSQGGGPTSLAVRKKVYYDLKTYAEKVLIGKCLGGKVITEMDWDSFQVVHREEEYDDCPPLSAVVNFCVNDKCALAKSEIGNPKGDVTVPERGSYSLKWNAGLRNRTSLLNECSLSDIWRGIADNNGLLSGDRVITQVTRGIYKYDFDCSGMENASGSSHVGNVTKSAYVNVGDIKSPIIESFTADREEITRGKGAYVIFTVKIGNPADVREVKINGSTAGLKKGATDTYAFSDSPVKTTDYTAQAASKWDAFPPALSKTISVTVKTLEPEIISFSSDIAEIAAGNGTPVTLTGKIRNPEDVESVFIYPLSEQRTDSDRVTMNKDGIFPKVVSPVKTTTYIVEAVSKWEELGSKIFNDPNHPVRILVKTPPKPDIAFCKIEPASIKAGKETEVTLSWGIKNPDEVESFYIKSSNAEVKGLTNFQEKTGSKKIFIPVTARDDIELTFFAKSKWKIWETISQPCAVIRIEYPSKPRIISFKAAPESVRPGESAVLEWEAQNAQAVSIDQGVGSWPVKGSIKVFPKFTTVYTLTAVGAIAEVGSAKAQTIIKVEAPELPLTPSEPQEIPEEETIIEQPKPVEKPKIDLKVDGQDGPITLAAPASFTLSWNLDKYCLVYGSWLGIKTKAGEERKTINKSGTYTYSINCPTIGRDEVTVNVVGGAPGGAVHGRRTVAVPLPIAEAGISVDGKQFSKSIRVVRGEPTEIWLSAGYDVNGDKLVSRDDTGKWTTAMSDGGQCQWNFDLNQGAPTFEGVTVDPQTPKDCTLSFGKLTFYDKAGVYRYGVLRLAQNDGKISNISYVNIAVQEPPPPNGPPVIDLRINGIENSVTLGAPAEYDVSWNVKNADACLASDAWSGEKFFSGSQHFVASSKNELNYILACDGKLGRTVKSVFLKVAELPNCEFSALPTVLDRQSVFSRQSVISWKCQFANRCSISPAVGASQETFGFIRVSPKITTTYTLTCDNLEGSNSFDETVEVK